MLDDTTHVLWFSEAILKLLSNLSTSISRMLKDRSALLRLSPTQVYPYSSLHGKISRYAQGFRLWWCALSFGSTCSSWEPFTLVSVQSRQTLSKTQASKVLNFEEDLNGIQTYALCFLALTSPKSLFETLHGFWNLLLWIQVWILYLQSNSTLSKVIKWSDLIGQTYVALEILNYWFLIPPQKAAHFWPMRSLQLPPKTLGTARALFPCYGTVKKLSNGWLLTGWISH